MAVKAPPLDLRAFLLRGHSIRLFRAALRSARRAPPNSRGDLEQTIRSEMERNRYEKNQQTIRFLISDGLQRLKQLNVMLGIQGYEEA
jgi:hypothetical protein